MSYTSISREKLGELTFAKIIYNIYYFIILFIIWNQNIQNPFVLFFIKIKTKIFFSENCGLIISEILGQ